MCLKELSFNQNISIISTIHQPNSDILQMFDRIYVLAKGGVCVYWGTPEHLPTHLEDCGIICNENQVPIETLIKIGSKGEDDPKNVVLRDKTNESFKQLFANRMNETKDKRIENRNKRFNCKDIYLLLRRSVEEFIGFKYVSIMTSMAAIVFTSCVLFFSFGSDIGEYNDCVFLNQNNNRSCLEQMDIDYMVTKNMNFMIFVIWFGILIECLISLTDKLTQFKVFTVEHQNS